ncbi:MAG: type II toxin-antitoxin system HicB family antitoxin [Thermomicrobiales bacterium]
MRYTVIVERGHDPGMYVVSVPTLPGCLTQGGSVDQALERIREAIADHIAALADLGESVPVETDPPLVTAVDVESAA